MLGADVSSEPWSCLEDRDLDRLAGGFRAIADPQGCGQPRYTSAEYGDLLKPHSDLAPSDGSREGRLRLGLLGEVAVKCHSGVADKELSISQDLD